MQLVPEKDDFSRNRTEDLEQQADAIRWLLENSEQQPDGSSLNVRSMCSDLFSIGQVLEQRRSLND